MVLNGLEQTEKYDRLFKGKRIGLITSPSGVDNNFNSSISIFYKKYKLAALFSPEHGVRGDIEAGALVDTYLILIRVCRSTVFTERTPKGLRRKCWTWWILLYMTYRMSEQDILLL